jgi:transposase-like protein
MPRGQKNNYTPTFKKQIALEAIKGEKTISQIAALYKVFPARIHQWRKQLLQGCEQVFLDDNPKDKIIAKKLLEKDFQIEDLQKKVGELTMANDFYKKKFPT